MKIISIEDNKIKLNSGILEEHFGRMSFSSILSEMGLLVHVIQNGNDFSFEYLPWSYSDIQSVDTEINNELKRIVYFTGDSPFSEKPESLLSIIKEKPQQISFNAGLCVLRILTDAAINNQNIPWTGAGATLIQQNNENSWTVLFLPAVLWTNASAALNETEKAENIHLWTNPSLSSYQALRFARANLAYKLLTGRFPFPAANTIERNADILDKKFLPIEMCIPNLPEALCTKINEELELNNSAVYIPGKEKKKKNKKSQTYASEKLKDSSLSNNRTDESAAQRAARLQTEYQKAVSAFPFDLFIEAEKNKNTISTEELSKKSEEYMARKSARIAAKRKLRRNAEVFIAVSLVSALILFFIGNSINSKKSDKTSRGLTSEQTTEAFYQSFNRLDTMFVYEHGKGKSLKAYADTVSNMYVIGKNRTAYSRDKGIQKPGAYFLGLKREADIAQAGLYGITNLSIDGKSKDMDLHIPERREKTKAIETDHGISVYDKMQSIHKVHYYLLHTEGTELMVEECTDTVTLTFTKDKWILTDIKSEPVFLKIKSNHFFDTYFNVLELTDKDTEATVRIMKREYPWLPSQKDFEIEKALIAEENAEMMRIFGQTANQQPAAK